MARQDEATLTQELNPEDHELDSADPSLEEWSQSEEWDEAGPYESSQHHVPSPAEIESMCREIRSEWSEAEHRRRAGYLIQPLQLATRPCRISLPDWA